MKRSQILINKALCVPYSKDELKSLLSVVQDYWLKEDYNDTSGFDFLELIGAIENSIKGMPLEVDRESNWILGYETNEYKGLNLMQFLLVYYRKLFILMTGVPKERLPLYLNSKPSLRMIAEWRLRIGT